ncbi:MAG: metal-dependent transcriptional regulator [Limnochordia bacterium]|nr:metal-dependent transcriptional regulator [Limnochordia bacterium]
MRKVTPSIQDYLKALLELSKGGEPVRSVDVARKLNVSRASVNRAMNVLKDMAYISKKRYGAISLTDDGKQAAKEVKKHNRIIKAFLVDVLGVEETIAINEACHMEHTISAETARKLEEYLKNVCNQRH